MNNQQIPSTGQKINKFSLSIKWDNKLQESHSVCQCKLLLHCQCKLFNYHLRQRRQKSHARQEQSLSVCCCAAHIAEQPEACFPLLLTNKLKTNISVCLSTIHIWLLYDSLHKARCLYKNGVKWKCVPSLFHMSKICLTLWLHTFILKSSVLWSYKALVKVTASLFFCAVLARLQLTYNHASTDSLGFLHIHNSCETSSHEHLC